MRFANSGALAAVLLSTGWPAVAQTGPVTTSIHPAPYDQVGRAIVMPEGAPAAAHATLPPGSYAEVTAIDSGRTVLVAITAVARPGHEIELSPAAAQELGLTPGRPAPVRVRAATAAPPDMAAFRTGSATSARPDAPPVLLTALRRKLAGLPPPGPAALARPVVPPARPTAARSGPAYYVQIAALSDPARAATVARSAGGQVSSVGRLHRVRLGPYPDQHAAQAARDGVARRGYGDARIVRE